MQAVGQVPVDVAASGVDALTMTGHKLGGPMGAGVLVLRRDAECTPLLHGGGQERDVRSGTLDVAAIVGLAVATTASVASRVERAARVAALRDRLVAGVVAGCPTCSSTDHRWTPSSRAGPVGCRATPTCPSPAPRATPC